jgi:hypothetical protein
MEPEIHYRIHKNSLLVLNQSQMKPVHTLSTYFFKINLQLHSNIFQVISSLWISRL